MRYALRAGALVSASGCAVSATTRSVSAFDTEVVIPNRTKYRTHRRLFSVARIAQNFQKHGFRLVARLERKTNAIPIVCAARRHLRLLQHRPVSSIDDLNERRTARFELFRAHVKFEVVF